MGLSIVCGACGGEAEHEEHWRGCYRPCPHCHARVQVPYAPESAPQPRMVEARCYCDALQASPDDGLWYEVQCEHRYSSEEGLDVGGVVRLGAHVLLGPIGALLGALASRGETVVERVRSVRWACPSCAVSVERARRWRVWGAILSCLVFMVIPWGGWALLLSQLEMREIDYRWPMLNPLMFLSFFVGPLLAYVGYHVGKRAVAWRFGRAHKGYTRVWWREDLVSPVLLLPDGAHVSTSVGAGPVSNDGPRP